MSGVQNPSKSGAPGAFRAEVLIENTTNATMSKSITPSFTIATGNIYNVSINPSGVARNLEVDYFISFNVHSGIEQGGRIDVIFPVEYTSFSTNSCSAEIGLEPISGDLVTCTTSGQTVSWSNFKAIEPSWIQLKVNTKNSTNLKTSFFQINTFAADGTAVDQNYEAYKIDFSSSNTPTQIDIDTFTQKVDRTWKEYGPIDLFIQPRTALPATTGGNVGQIDVDFISANVQAAANTTPGCYFGKDKVPASECTLTGTVLTIKTPATMGLDTCGLAISLTSLPELAAVGDEGWRYDPAQTSAYVGVVDLNVKLYDSAGVSVVEEVNFKLLPKASDLQNMTIDYFNVKTDTANWVKIKFDVDLQIPLNGFVDFEFMTESYGWPYNLGYGERSGNTVAYPGGSSTHGSGAAAITSCNLTSGTTITPALVRYTMAANIASADTIDFHFPKLTNGPYAGVEPWIRVTTRAPTGYPLETGDIYLTDDGNQSGNPRSLDVGTGSVTSSDSTFGVGAGAADIRASGENKDLVMNFPWDMNGANGGKFWFQLPTTGYKHSDGTKYFIDPINDGKATGFQVNNEELFVGGYGALDNTSTTAGGETVQITLEKDYSYAVASTATPPDAFTIIFVEDATNPIVVDEEASNAVGYVVSPKTGSLTISNNAVVVQPTADNFSDMSSLFNLQFSISEDLVRTGAHVVIELDAGSFTTGGTNCIRASGVLNAATTTVVEFTCTVDGLKVKLESFTTTTVAATDFDITFSATVSGTGNLDYKIYTVDGTDDQKYKVEEIEVSGASNAAKQFTSTMSAAAPAPTSFSVETFYQPDVPWLAGTYAPIKFQMSPVAGYPATSDFNSAYVKVTFPQDGTFDDPVTSYLLDCYFGTTKAAKCEYDESGTPKWVKAYIPVGMTITNAVTDMTISTIDPNTAGQIGFLAPTTGGDYQFNIGVYINNNADATEEFEPFIHIPKAQFDEVTVHSMTRTRAMPNVLTFRFTLVSTINDANSLTDPGFIDIELPYDSAGKEGFKDLLGLDDLTANALYNGATEALDCPTTGDHDATIAITCTIMNPSDGKIRVRVAGFTGASAGKVLNFRFMAKNPDPDGTNNITMLDLNIKIASYNLELSTGKLTLLDSYTSDYVDTIEGQPSIGAETDTDDNNLMANTGKPQAANQTLQLNLKTVASVTLAKGFALVQVPTSEFTLETDTPTGAECTINGVQASTLSTTPSCFISIGFCFIYNDAAPGDWAAGSPQIVLQKITNGSHINVDHSFKTWLIDAEGETQKEVTHDTTSFASNAIAVDDIATFSIDSYADLTKNNRSFYSIKVVTDTTFIPAGGMVYVKFGPSGVAHYDLIEETCRIGAETKAQNIDTVFCTVTNPGGAEPYLYISGFTSNVDISTDAFHIEIEAINPSAVGNTNIDALVCKDTTIPCVDKVAELAASHVNAIVDTPDAGLSQASATAITTYYDQYFVRGDANNKVGPIRFSIQPSADMTKAVGFVTLTTTQQLSLPADGELRCIWTKDGTTDDLIAKDCTLSGTYEIKVYTPRAHDITAADLWHVKITTLNGRVNGVSFDDGTVEYAFDFIVDPTGAGTNTSADQKYVSLIGSDFAKLIVTQDHGIEDKYDQWRIKIATNAALGIDASADATAPRIVLEWQNSVFGHDLGSGRADGDEFPCLNYGQLQPETVGSTIKCRLKHGALDGSDDYNPQVWVDDFAQLNAGTEFFEIRLLQIKNPAIVQTGGSTACITHATETAAVKSDTCFSQLRVFVTAVQNGYPGDRAALFDRTVKYVSRIREQADYAGAANANAVVLNAASTGAIVSQTDV